MQLCGRTKIEDKHEAMVGILKPLRRCGIVGFEESGDAEEKWMWFLVIMFYCCDTAEGMTCQFKAFIGNFKAMQNMHGYSE